jgi:hypothetical protein
LPKWNIILEITACALCKGLLRTSSFGSRKTAVFLPRATRPGPRLATASRPDYSCRSRVRTSGRPTSFVPWRNFPQEEIPPRDVRRRVPAKADFPGTKSLQVVHSGHREAATRAQSPLGSRTAGSRARSPGEKDRSLSTTKDACSKRSGEKDRSLSTTKEKPRTKRSSSKGLLT